MYPISTRMRLGAVLVVLFSTVVGPARAYAHGGGGGHGGGGHGGGGHGGGYHSSFSGGGSGGGSFGFRSERIPGAGAEATRLVVNSPGFPEDLPEARIHRFL